MTRLIDTEAAAIAVGVHPATIRRWVNDKRLTNYGEARRVRVDLDELLDVAAQR